VHILELKVPPPLVAVLVAMIMWLAAWAAPALRFEVPGRRVIAPCLAVVGMAVSIAGIVSFRRARTTVNPLKPESASSLVVAGIWQGSGVTMAILLAGLRGVDEEIWKAARVDGIPTWRTHLSSRTKAVRRKI